ncbi:MAG: hypothetical protein OEL91_03565, partial [Burkholderiaceae bacterium]|nr:hypothetical protein [Burkholderiaceae bacterium]
SKLIALSVVQRTDKSVVSESALCTWVQSQVGFGASFQKVVHFSVMSVRSILGRHHGRALICINRTLG